MIEQQSNDNEAEKDDKKVAVNIQPSEPKNASSDQEENAPGRTPGKAEGSREILEADLADKKDE